jgi:hypothetical protein
MQLLATRCRIIDDWSGEDPFPDTQPMPQQLGLFDPPARPVPEVRLDPAWFRRLLWGHVKQLLYSERMPWTEAEIAKFTQEFELFGDQLPDGEGQQLFGWFQHQLERLRRGDPPPFRYVHKPGDVFSDPPPGYDIV